MSIWTHCSGVIRFDAVRFNIYDCLTREDFDKIFITSSYNNPNPNCNMPCGSEGSIKYSLQINYDFKNVSNAYVLTFTGDLRSYNNIEEIKSWWYNIKNLVNTLKTETKKPIWIRDGSMVVKQEYTKKALLLGFCGDVPFSYEVEGEFDV